MEAAFVAVYNSITHRAFRTAKSILTQPDLAKNEDLRLMVSDAFHVVAVSAGLRTMAILQCSPGWVSPLSNLYVARYAHPNLVKHNLYSYIIANKDKISEKTFHKVVEQYSKDNRNSYKRIGELLGYFQTLDADDDRDMPYTLKATMILPTGIYVNCGPGEWGPQSLYEITPKLIRQAKHLHEQLNHLSKLIYPELKFNVSIKID
jgi:hypothetical protein